MNRADNESLPLRGGFGWRIEDMVYTEIRRGTQTSTTILLRKNLLKTMLQVRRGSSLVECFQGRHTEASRNDKIVCAAKMSRCEKGLLHGDGRHIVRYSTLSISARSVPRTFRSWNLLNHF